MNILTIMFVKFGTNLKMYMESIRYLLPAYILYGS